MSNYHSYSKHFAQHSNFAKARSEHISQAKMSHSIGVAEYMRERADEYGLDGNIAYITGLLHDIGYLEGRLGHEQIGGEILTAMQMPEWLCQTIRNHAKELATLPTKEVTPMLVLLVEADLSLETHGYRVGFDKRTEDIAKRYGNENNPQFDIVKSNVEFIKKYQKEHGITPQEETIKRKSTGKANHGSGKFVGSETKAKILSEVIQQEKIEEVNEEETSYEMEM
jgi:putative nucleotidyltransferase with HDIG domain